jgi:hypothetical protein
VVWRRDLLLHAVRVPPEIDDAKRLLDEAKALKIVSNFELKGGGLGVLAADVAQALGAERRRSDAFRGEVLAWLGMWRDGLPHKAVLRLQGICDKS